MFHPRCNVVLYRHMEATARPKKVIFAFKSSSQQQALKFPAMNRYLGHENSVPCKVRHGVFQTAWVMIEKQELLVSAVKLQGKNLTLSQLDPGAKRRCCTLVTCEFGQFRISLCHYGVLDRLRDVFCMV